MGPGFAVTVEVRLPDVVAGAVRDCAGSDNLLVVGFRLVAPDELGVPVGVVPAPPVVLVVVIEVVGLVSGVVCLHPPNNPSVAISATETNVFLIRGSAQP